MAAEVKGFVTGNRGWAMGDGLRPAAVPAAPAWRHRIFPVVFLATIVCPGSSRAVAVDSITTNRPRWLRDQLAAP